MEQEDEWFDDFEEDSYGGGDSDASPSYDSDAELQGEQATASYRPKQAAFTIIPAAALKSIQHETLEQVQSIMGCSTTTARALLSFFSWDVESVLSTIAERGEEEVYKRAGVAPTGAAAAAAAAAASNIGRGGRSGGASSGPPGSDASVCAVCFTEAGAVEGMVTMPCGHSFCAGCWRQHLSIGVREGLGRRLKCMAPKCGVLCDEDRVEELLRDDPALLEKYESALIDGYVDDNRRVRWCPSTPHCGNAVRVNGDPHCEVECPCSKQFCFACGEAPHSPATCNMVRQWVQSIRDGSETASWLQANTKPCPKCAKPVEKNGGCNLVLCRCGQAFCWLCGQATGRAHDWHQISGHSCGAYKDDAEKEANEGQRNLKRYLHYLMRYEAHLGSLKFEEAARTQLENKIDAMVETETSLSNFSWLSDALQQLFLARRVMAYSYVMAYYLFGPSFADEFPPEVASTNKELFEDKQGQLEIEVERLAELVERAPQGSLAESRLTVVNLTSTINARIVKMYQVVENDIAPQVAGRSMAIAPYAGQRSKEQIKGEVAGEALMVEGEEEEQPESSGSKRQRQR